MEENAIASNLPPVAPEPAQRPTESRSRLACSQCGRSYPDGAESSVCGDCSDVLEVRYPQGFGDLTCAKEVFRLRRASPATIDRSGVWRFRELLPFMSDAAQAVTLQEGDTPELDAPRASRWCDAQNMKAKLLSYNPSGSYKDAGMTAAISKAVEAGARAVACASTGNTAASVAMYAARADLPAVVFLPAGDVAESKLVQTLDAGARVYALDGDFDVAMRVVRELADRGIVYLVNSLNPYRREGQKTVAFEILEARGWRAPDWVVVPGGNLGHCTALAKGFAEARKAELVASVPHIAVVQASGAAPFVSAWQQRKPLVPVKAETFATAIKVGNPVSWRPGLRALADTDGVAVHVDDATIAEARAVLARDGLACEPASAAALAAVRALRLRGVIRADEDTVILLTGSGLKDPTSAIAYHSDAKNAHANAAVKVDADIDAVLRMLEAVL